MNVKKFGIISFFESRLPQGSVINGRDIGAGRNIKSRSDFIR